MEIPTKNVFPNYYYTMSLLEKILYWIPRALSVGYVIFISIFALDVFSEYSGVETIIPLLMHLFPSFTLLIITVIAWRYELVGTLIFLGFALLYVWDVGLTRPPSWYIAIAVPASIVGIMYLICWIQKQSRKRTKT